MIAHYFSWIFIFILIISLFSHQKIKNLKNELPQTTKIKKNKFNKIEIKTCLTVNSNKTAC
jgi:hypothetical protein